MSRRLVLRVVLIAAVFGLLVLLPIVSAVGTGRLDVAVEADTRVSAPARPDAGSALDTAPDRLQAATDALPTASATGAAQGVLSHSEMLDVEAVEGEAVGTQSETTRVLSASQMEEAATAGAIALGTAGGFGLLFWAKNALGFGATRFLAAPLLSRIQKDDLLENDGRELLYQLVTANPGISLAQIAEESGLGWGTTVYHLGRLQEAGFITSMKNGQGRHFFKNGHPAAKSKKAVAMLKNPTAADVARFLMSTPGATQSSIAKGLGLGAPTVTKYVKRLEGEGLVDVVAAGRTKIVSPTASLGEVLQHMETPAATVDCPVPAATFTGPVAAAVA